MANAVISIIGMALVGVVGWVIQLGSRTAVLEALLKEKWDSVDHRLARIERHVLNGTYEES